MKKPKNIFLFFLFLLCSIPSLIFALSIPTQVTPASIKSGKTPFEFEVTPINGGIDISFSADPPRDGSGTVRAYLALFEITNRPENAEPPEKGRLRHAGEWRTRRLRDISLQEKDGKTFAKFHIDPELLKKDNLSFVYVIPSIEMPVVGIYNFYIADFLPQAEPVGADQPATAPESKSGGKVKPQTEAEARSR